eukprot:m51a1_g11133 hypothetical protein (175) ;mRNA; f:172026-173881
MLASHRSRAVALVVAMASASLMFHQWASWDGVLLSEIRDGPYALRLAASQDDSELSVYVPQTRFPDPGPDDVNASTPSRDEETLSCEGPHLAAGVDQTTAMAMARQKDRHGCTSELHDQMLINCLCFDSSPATPLMQSAMKELGLQCRTTTWQYGVFLEYPAALKVCTPAGTRN